MTVGETVARWVDTIGALEAINLTLFSILIVGGSLSILWARKRALVAKRAWREQGAVAQREAESTMEEINRDLASAIAEMSDHRRSILERVRKDAGRQY